MSTSAVSIKNLSKSYKDFKALHDVSLEVPNGTTLVLLGPSGCGKTSILRCIAGLESPTGGTIEVNGKIVASSSARLAPEKRGVGMVFQSYALWPHLSVLDNVIFACRYGAGLKKSEARAEAVSQLERFGLQDLMSRYPGQLSGGQQQRVALSRAIASRPQVLLMDEPLSALDQQLREDLRVSLKASIQSTGLACVYVTHDQYEAMAMADTVAVLQGGRVAELGSPQSVYSRPQTLFGARFLGGRNLVRDVELLGRPDDGKFALGRKGACTFEFSPVSADRAAAATGQRFDLAWRPSSSVAVTEARPGQPGLVGKIKSLIYLGGETQVQVVLETGEEIHAISMLGSAGIGDTCHVYNQPEEVLGYEQG